MCNTFTEFGFAAALTDGGGQLGLLLGVVQAYERGELIDERVTGPVRAYFEALRWSTQHGPGHPHLTSGERGPVPIRNRPVPAIVGTGPKGPGDHPRHDARFRRVEGPGGYRTWPLPR